MNINRLLGARKMLAVVGLPYRPLSHCVCRRKQKYTLYLKIDEMFHGNMFNL